MYQLTGTALLEHHLYRSPYGDLVRRNAGQVGVEIDSGLLIQGNYGQIVGLIRHAPIQPAILDEDIRGDVALPSTSLQASFSAEPHWRQLRLGGYCSRSQLPQSCKTSRFSFTASQKGWLTSSGTGITFGIFPFHF